MSTYRDGGAAPVALAAIDVAKSQHVALIELPNGQRKKWVLPNTKEGFERFARELQRLQVPCHIAFEATGDYHRPLASFLGRQGFQLYLVSSLATCRTREALYNAWDKNDPKDAQVILHLLKTGGTQIYHDPLTTGYNDLHELAKTYQQISLRKVRLLHSIITHFLPLYFPEADRYVGGTRAEWYVRLLLLAPCPAAVLRYSKAEFIRTAGSTIPGRKHDKQRWLADFYAAAKTSVGLPVSEDSEAIRMFRVVLQEYAELWALRDRLEREAERRLSVHPDYQRLRSVPGIGPVLALLILAEGGDLRRFSHHRKFLKYCGLNLCTEQSGRARGSSRLSKRGNARLRSAFWMAAVVAIRMRQNGFSRKFDAYVRSDPTNADLRRKGYTAVAAKMARVVYGLIKRETDYCRFIDGATPSGRIPTSERVEATISSTS
jgi:transposase